MPRPRPFRDNPELARAAARKQKRGLSTTTKVRNMLNAVDLDDNTRVEIVKKLITGSFGDNYQAMAAHEVLKQLHQQELTLFKKDVSVEQHREMREIDNNLDTQLLLKLVGRLSKDISTDEVKKMIREVRDGNESSE